MKRQLINKTSYFMLLLLLLQVLNPFASAFAADGILLPPSNLASQQVTPDDAKLTWSSVYGAAGYNVYEIKEGQIILLGKSTSDSYNLTNLAEGSYRFVVSTLSAEGESGPSAPVSVDITYPEMAAPSTLTQSIKNGNDIVLSWGTSAYAEKYNIYQVSVDGQETLVTSTSAKTYTISSSPEGNFVYAVKAMNTLYGESPLSDSVQVDVVYPVLTGPADFTYSVTNGSDVTFKWTAVPYATNYNLYQIVDGQPVLKNTLTTTTVKLVNLPSGDYVYAIKSNSDRFGESAESSELAVTVSAVTMEAPSDFAYTLQNTNDIVLTWKSVPNATGYKIYQIVDGEKVLKSTVTSTSVKYLKMPAGDYSYEVHSYSDRFGESAEAGRVDLTVDGVLLAAPENLEHKIQNGNDVVLSWSSAADATSYKVYQIVDGQKVLKTTTAKLTSTYANMPFGDYIYEVHSYSDRFGESSEGVKINLTVDVVSMKAPGDLTYNIKNGNDVVLNWTGSENATSYKVYQIVDGKKVLRTVTGTSVTYSNMPAGNYAFEVYSYSDRFGESKASGSISLDMVHPTMMAPANLKETIKSDTSFTLTWDATEYATNYKVYQIVNGQKILKSTVTGTSATYSNMPSGDYVYEVYSYSARFGESAEGTQVTFLLKGKTMQAPINLTNSITNGNDIRLSWSAAENATGYKVYQIIDGEKILKSTLTGTAILFKNMPAGDYTYIIHSDSTTHGESELGAEVTFSLIHPTMQMPENVTYKLQNGNDVVLSWEAATYATGYNVYELVEGQKVLLTSVTTPTAVLRRVPVGEHTYVIHSESSRFGESQEGSERAVTLNEYTMEAPENGTYSITKGNSITLKWDATTYATSYKVYRVMNDQKDLVSTVTGTAVTYSNMPEGNYEYEVHSYSDRFGESPAGSEISGTLVFPTMQAPENLTQSISNGNDIILRWNDATFATSYKVYQIIDGQPILKQTVTDNVAALRNMPEGEYEYKVHAVSTRFGESPEGSTSNVQLTWPVVQPPVLTGDFFNVNNVTLSWKAIPWANEYRVYQIIGDSRNLIYKGTTLSYKVYNLTEDTHSFEVTAYSNRFGESEVSNGVTEKVVYPDMQSPSATLTVLSDSSARIVWDFVTYANGYNIYEIIDDNPVLIAEKVNNLSYTVSNLSYANHEYYVTSQSNSFGESQPSNTILAKLIVDTEAPVTKADAPIAWTNQNPVVTLTATDYETGVANTYYALNEKDFVEGTSFTLTEEGVHKVSFYSVDKVGNKESIQTIDVKIDQTAPISKVSDIPSWSNQPINLDLNAEDEQSGIADTYYSVNGSEFQVGSTLTVDQEGINEVSFYSVDNAGNKEDLQMVEVKLDKEAPVTSSNAEESWLNDRFVLELTANDELSGAVATFYSVNGSEFAEGNSVTISQEGNNIITFYSIDNSGNKEEVKTAEVKIDKSAPETASNSTDIWHNEFIVELTATDELSEVASTYYSINGSDFAEGTSFKVMEEGINRVSYYSVDNAGNKEEVKTVEVKIDQTSPVTVSNVADQWILDSFIVNLKATDSYSGTSVTYYSINGSEFTEGTSFTVSEEGLNKVSYYSVDNAGNKEEAKTVEVKIDKTVPTAVWELKDIYALGTKLPLTYAAKDTVSGIKSESLTVNGKTYKNGDSITFTQPGKYIVQVTVTDNVGLTTTLEKTIVVYIPAANIKVNPGVIKDNGGVFTVDVSLPKGFNTKDFRLDTVSINGVSAISGKNGYEKQAEKGQFKFNRDDFDWNNGKQTLEFSGMVGDYLVLGTTEVEVKGSKNHSSNNGHHHGFNFWEWLVSLVKRTIGQ